MTVSATPFKQTNSCLTQRGGGTAPRIHNLGIRWSWVNSLTLRPPNS